jgi:hypothetical protein
MIFTSNLRVLNMDIRALAGKIQFFSASATWAASVFACLLNASTVTAEPAPPYEQVHRILTAACGKCHMNGHHRGGIQLNTELQLERDAEVILTSIETSDMPYMDPTWNQTAQGKLVIRYLKAKLGQTDDDNN